MFEKLVDKWVIVAYNWVIGNKGGDGMKEITCLEETKKDAEEMAQILSEIPENKKMSVYMLIRGFKLGIESEMSKAAAG